jgi:hypothetical protein
VHSPVNLWEILAAGASNFSLLLACLTLTTGLGACGEGKSYVVVRMLLQPDQEPLPNVASLRVTITAATLSVHLTYPAKTGSPLTIRHATALAVG